MHVKDNAVIGRISISREGNDDTGIRWTARRRCLIECVSSLPHPLNRYSPAHALTKYSETEEGTSMGQKCSKVLRGSKMKYAMILRYFSIGSPVPSPPISPASLVSSTGLVKYLYGKALDGIFPTQCSLLVES